MKITAKIDQAQSINAAIKRCSQKFEKKAICQDKGGTSQKFPQVCSCCLPVPGQPSPSCFLLQSICSTPQLGTLAALHQPYQSRRVG